MHSLIHPASHQRRTLYAWMLPLVLAFILLGASSAFAITRNTVLSRAQRRVDLPVKYSQSKYYAGYRTDCSGYVSMCWATGTSWNTRTFHKVTHRIRVSSLQPGDALLKKGYHIRLFYGWVDDSHTQYVAYESANGRIAGTRIHSIADDIRAGYKPVRYDRITSSATSRNLLKNPTFNTWAGSWSGAAAQPVWWQTGGGEWWESITKHRKDTYRTARNSLELLNTNDDPEMPTELSQTVAIKSGATYQLKAWAKTAHDPAGVEMVLSYLDAAGESFAETSTVGAAWGVNPASFKSMSLQAAAPANAVAARVSIRLAGATNTEVPDQSGTSVILDDISLARPQVTVGIKSNRSSVKRGKSVVVGGSVGPVTTVGAPAVVYVKKPGGNWLKLTAAKVAASGGSGAWKATVRFKKSARKGTYQFKTTIPAVPGYLGATSSAVKVTVK